MENKINPYDIEELYKLSQDYKIIEPFLKKSSSMNYMEFDYNIVHHLTLFSIEPEYDFNELENILERILKTLPAIKRIFSKPVLHLTEKNEILPVESVRVINNQTIQHISGHSELWDNVHKNEIKPLKLLTKTYQDNYGIYENIVFCKMIDDILFFVRNNIRILKDLIYTNQTIEINILERVNHLNYFLALGKLHTGYIRNFEKYYEISKRCLEKITFIYNTIVPRLKRPVYKFNKVKPKKLSIHKTNILSMHRDYHQIYMLSKYFSNHHLNNLIETENIDISSLKSNYFYFCLILSIFSIGHFNFVCDEQEHISLKRLNAIFKFKKWELMISNKIADKIPIIIINISKDTFYKIILVPSIVKNKEIIAKIKEKYEANEYIFCSPIEQDIEDCCFLSISNVESFRRLQQIILRGMIYSDTKRKDCPFCNNKIVLNKEESTKDNIIYECSSCRTRIGQRVCPTHQKKYYYTDVLYLNKHTIDHHLYAKEDNWIFNRKVESQLYFRNITRINNEMDNICPFCHKVHK